MHEPSNRSLTLGYSIALAIIAAMSVGSHLALSRVLKEHASAAAVINMSGRQRMLSQRIAGSAAELALGAPGAREDLQGAVDLFERSNRDLIFGNRDLNVPPATSDLRAIYFEGTSPLDGAVSAFVARGRRLLAMTPEAVRASSDLAALMADARTPLLARLNDVVSLHQRISEGQMRLFERLEDGSLSVILLTLLGEALLIFRPMAMRITRYTRALVTIASTDHLTQILNRRSLYDRAAALVQRLRHEARPLSVLLIDVDRFKSVNDTFGHAAGDAVLQGLSATLKLALRPSDLLGRLGGEEFCAVLPDANLTAAVAIAERLREAAAALVVPVGDAAISFTISIGATESAPGDPSFQASLDRADRAVYRAKAGGRDRVVAATARDEAVPEKTQLPAEPQDTRLRLA